MEVKDKVVIVTGASSGIGLAAARLFAEKRAKVALVARSTGKLQNIAKELKDSFVVTADMSRENDVRKMVKKVKDHYGRIDILINNAGRGYDAMVEEIDMKEFHALFDLNLAGVLAAMQEVIPVMRSQGQGTIVNISSGTSLMFLPNMSAYSSLKRALNGISLTAREELAKDNISVSVVYPYITRTDFDKNMIGAVRNEHLTETNSDLPPSDEPEHVAKKILEAVESAEAEVFAHDWMKKMGK